MSNHGPAGEESTPGYRTVWQAPDVGPQQAVVCPRCRVEIGSVSERGEAQLFCTHRKTVYKVKGRRGGTPTLKRLGQRVVVQGENKLAQMMRGGFDDSARPLWATVGFHILLWAILLVALAFALWW
jgi:hypothetical protein